MLIFTAKFVFRDWIWRQFSIFFATSSFKSFFSCHIFWCNSFKFDSSQTIFQIYRNFHSNREKAKFSLSILQKKMLHEWHQCECKNQIAKTSFRLMPWTILFNWEDRQINHRKQEQLFRNVFFSLCGFTPVFHVCCLRSDLGHTLKLLTVQM